MGPLDTSNGGLSQLGYVLLDIFLTILLKYRSLTLTHTSYVQTAFWNIQATPIHSRTTLEETFLRQTRSSWQYTQHSQKCLRLQVLQTILCKYGTMQRTRVFWLRTGQLIWLLFYLVHLSLEPRLYNGDAAYLVGSKAFDEIHSLISYWMMPLSTIGESKQNIVLLHSLKDKHSIEYSNRQQYGITVQLP